MNPSIRTTATAAMLLTLVACATSPTSAISSGRAVVLPGTSQADILSAKALIAVEDQRFAVAVYIDDCRRGQGTIRTEAPHYETLTNLIAAGTTPADRMFAKICADAGPMIKKQEEERARRWASMTPEERENERRLLLQLFLLQQNQQTESARNRSREQAAKEIADSIREGQKSQTECTASTPLTVKCVTQPKK